MAPEVGSNGGSAQARPTADDHAGAANPIAGCVATCSQCVNMTRFTGIARWARNEELGHTTLLQRYVTVLLGHGTSAVGCTTACTLNRVAGQAAASSASHVGLRYGSPEPPTVMVAPSANRTGPSGGPVNTISLVLLSQPRHSATGA